MAEVPMKIKVLAGIFALSGGWAIALGVLGIIYGTPILADLAYVLIASGFINIGLAYGLYKGFKWAWVVAMIFVVLSVVIAVFQYLRYGSFDYLSLIMNAIIAIALIYSADYYGIKIGFLPQPKAATATVKMLEEMKYFKRIQ